MVCTAGKRPRAHKGKLPANSVIRAIHVRRSHGREQLSFTGVYPGKLKVTLASRTKPSRTKKIQRKIAACHAYTVGLPSGHWKLTILATVGKAAQHASAKY